MSIVKKIIIKSFQLYLKTLNNLKIWSLFIYQVPAIFLSISRDLTNFIVYHNTLISSSSVIHYFVFVSFLHFTKEFQYFHQVLFEAPEYSLLILTCPFMFVQAVHAVRDCVFGQLCATPAHIVMVDIDHAELRLELHCLGEKCHKLVECLFCVGHLWIIDENYTMSILLDRSPTLFILEVATCVPQLYMKLSEV